MTIYPTLSLVYQNGLPAPTVRPQSQDVKFDQGATARIPFVVVDVLGAVVDITGANLVMTWRDSLGAPMTRLTVDSTITDAANGKGYFPFVTADTAAIDAGAYIFDVWIIWGTGGAGSSGDQDRLCPKSTVRVDGSVYER